MKSDDLKKIGQLLDEKLTATESRIDEKLAATESRIDEKFVAIESSIDEKLTATESRIIGEVGKFIEDHLFPMLEDKADKSDIERLERKLDHFSGQVVDHGQDLQKIKAIPVIAHELRSK